MSNLKKQSLKNTVSDDCQNINNDDYFLLAKDNYFNCKFFSDVISLNKDEECDLFKKLKKGDKTVVEKIVFHNLKYVYYIARSYTNDPYLLEELFQQGSYGLMKALKTFDYQKVLDFLPMLLIASENILLTFKNYNLIRISRDDYRELNKLNEKISMLEKKYQRTVTDQEISEYTGYSVDKIREIKRRELTFISLEQYGKDQESFNVLDYYFDRKNKSIHIDMAGDIIKQLKDEKNQFILTKYLGLEDGIEYTFEEIGNILGITKQAVKKRYDKSIKEIRRILKEDYDK